MSCLRRRGARPLSCIHASCRRRERDRSRRVRRKANMSRIQPVNPTQAAGKAKQLLDAVQVKLGLTPNMMKTMAQSPAVLEAYLNFSGALAEGALDAQFREEIALTVAQANSCEYCLSAHTTIGGLVKLTKEEIAGARQAQEKEAKRDAGLKFAQALVVE